MSYYRIKGGARLTGEITVHGAKNSVLPILSATILAEGTSVIKNCPSLSDVAATIAILKKLGCTVTQQGSTITVDSTTLNTSVIPCELMLEMRSSVLFLGALLARTKTACICAPGGCKLGERPIDFHLQGLQQMGVKIREIDGMIFCKGARNPRPTVIALPLPSVGATENLMLAACGNLARVTLTGVAREPEIVDLQHCLVSMGADIRGAGSDTIVINGGRNLVPTEHQVMGDRIVATTYLAAAATTGGTVAIRGVSAEHLTAVLEVFDQTGCYLSTRKNAITLATNGALHAPKPIKTAPYPNFPTDAQAIIMATLCRSEGSTQIHETMFTSRYHHVPELERMGACITLDGGHAVVTGRHSLSGAVVQGQDLRATAALVVASLGANGTSHVYGLDHLHRGYERMEQDLLAMGAEIQKI